MKKRALAAMMAFAMSAALLTACGGDSKPAAPAQTQAAAPAATEAAKAEQKTEAAAPAVSDDKPVTIKLSSNKPNGAYMMQGAQRMKERVESESNGSITIELYPDSQLGGQNEAVEGMQMGTIEMAFVASAATDSFYPATSLLGTLFVAQNEEHAMNMYTGEKAQEIYGNVINEIGVRPLAFVIEGARNVWSKAPIEKLSDLKGLKMRVPEVPMFINIFQSIGVNPTPMSVAEVYTGLQTGIIDGLEFDMTGVVDNNFADHCKYCYMTNHGVSINSIFVSENFWQGLSANQQEILSKNAQLLADELNQEYYDKKAASVKALEEKGVTFVEVSDADRADMMAAIDPILLDVIKDYGTAEDLENLRALAK